jgi:NAD(P)-dependent dehydrogenase (short-subunit alcohol dehydrogenase family)
MQRGIVMGVVEGKSGVVTGAASGLGRAAALALAAQGASVVVSDLSSRQAGGEETVALIEQAGGDATFVACDVTSEEDQRRLVGACVSAFGRLDFAHNNAGFGQIPKAIEDTPIDDFNASMDVNVRGVFLGMKHQLSQMRQQGAGSIVNTASSAGTHPHPYIAAYVASKHAVIGLTKSVAMEAGDAGIRVNCICPGAMRTPMLGSVDAELQQRLVAPQAIKRLSEPAEAAEAVVWLVSDHSAIVTGAALPVDRGLTAGITP